MALSKDKLETAFSEELAQLEEELWCFESEFPDVPLTFSDDAMRGAVNIFVTCMLSRMWDKQEKSNVPFEIRTEAVRKYGDAFRKLIKGMTGIDPHDLYRNK